MTSKPIPAAIENVCGMPAMMRKAGIASSGRCQSLPWTSRVISAPTVISASAIAG